MSRDPNFRSLKYTFNYDQTIEGEMVIDLGRFEGQFSKAQFALDSMVMTDMIPLMPKQTGEFINVTKAMSAAIAGSGTVVAAAPPFGRFLYHGKTMVDPNTGSTWAQKDIKKVLVSQYAGKTAAKENLDFSKGANPDAQPEWFEEAKRQHKDDWIRMVKMTAGGGTNGR